MAGTLIAGGNNPNLAIGSVNLTELFTTIIKAVTFTAFVKNNSLDVVIGLAIGGLIAAPLSAHTCKRMPTKTLMKFVGLMTISLGVRNIHMALANHF